MSQFDDELRREVAPVAEEPLPAGVLDEALDVTPPARWPAVAASIAVVIVLAVAAGIGIGRQLGDPGPAPSPSETASIEPVPQPTPSESLPLAETVTKTVEDQGIRLTLTLDRDRIAFGERTWADVTVENIGTDIVYWGHSGSWSMPPAWSHMPMS